MRVSHEETEAPTYTPSAPPLSVCGYMGASSSERPQKKRAGLATKRKKKQTGEQGIQETPCYKWEGSLIEICFEKIQQTFRIVSR